MDQALLLGTGQGVVNCIEVGNENAFESLKKLLRQISLTRLGLEIDNFAKCGEDPNVGRLAV